MGGGGEGYESAIAPVPVCGFSLFLSMINLKIPYLFAPPGPTNYDKVTDIVSSNL